MRLAWSGVEGWLRGPYRAPVAGEERVFEVEEGGAGGLRFGRVASGPAWPAGLPRLDRFAAVPEPAGGAPSSPTSNDLVLSFQEEGVELRPLCRLRTGGGVVWSIDPATWIRALLDENYVQGWSRPLPSRIPLWNYSRAPFAVKRVLVRLQNPSREPPPPPLPFPELPLDDLADSLRRLCARLAWDAAGPDRELWPDGAQAAVAVTHDVDTGWILDPARSALLGRILDEESRLGFPGAWYVVADQVRAEHALALQRIRTAGHELGAHGWNHDGRLGYLRAEEQRGRMQKITGRLAGLGVSGMRTPWYARSRTLFAAIGEHFSYDSSVPNASGFFSRLTRSGCCSLFPYAPRPGLVELPMTVPADMAFSVERRRSALGAVAEAIIERGGVVVLTFHPQPHQSANEAGLAAHLGLLCDLRDRYDGRLWCATPAQIVERYRRRI